MNVAAITECTEDSHAVGRLDEDHDPEAEEDDDKRIETERPRPEHDMEVVVDDDRIETALEEPTKPEEKSPVNENPRSPWLTPFRSPIKVSTLVECRGRSLLSTIETFLGPLFLSDDFDDFEQEIYFQYGRDESTSNGNCLEAEEGTTIRIDATDNNVSQSELEDAQSPNMQSSNEKEGAADLPQQDLPSDVESNLV
jgi:hypothetical protein